MDRPELRIPVVVAAKRGEYPLRRKGQGSLATIFGQGLAGPKMARNTVPSKKEKGLTFPCHEDTCRKACRHLTLQDRSGGVVALLVRPNSGECHNDENQIKVAPVPRKRDLAASRSP